MTAPENIHGTGLVVDGVGVLLRGPSGTGKSLLALEILSRYPKAILVADDRIDLTVDDNLVTMQTPKQIAGLIELRGRGIIERPFQALAPLHLVVDLVDALERFPKKKNLVTQLKGITLAHCPIPKRGAVDSTHQILLFDAALAHTKSQLARGLKKPLDT